MTDPDTDTDTEPDTTHGDDLSDHAIDTIIRYKFPDSLSESVPTDHRPQFKPNTSIEAVAAIMVAAGVDTRLTSYDVADALAIVDDHTPDDDRYDYPRGTASPRLKELAEHGLINRYNTHPRYEHELSKTGKAVLTGEMDPLDHYPFSHRVELTQRDTDTYADTDPSPDDTPPETDSPDDGGGTPSTADTTESTETTSDGGVATDTVWSTRTSAPDTDTPMPDTAELSTDTEVTPSTDIETLTTTLSGVADDLSALAGEDDAHLRGYSRGITRVLTALGEAKTDTINTDDDNDSDDA